MRLTVSILGTDVLTIELSAGAPDVTADPDPGGPFGFYSNGTLSTDLSPEPTCEAE